MIVYNKKGEHTADIANKLAMGILGSGNKTEIGPFLEKKVSMIRKNLQISYKQRLILFTLNGIHF